MVNDPEVTFEKVRQERGEAAAARTVIGISKMVMAAFIAFVIIAVGGFFIMGTYAANGVSTCRDIVEDRFFATVGNGLLELRETGQMEPATAQDLRARTDEVEDITGQCPDAFWPWDVPVAPVATATVGPAVDPEVPVRSTTTPGD